jgi:hypothetical protein
MSNFKFRAQYCLLFRKTVVDRPESEIRQQHQDEGLKGGVYAEHSGRAADRESPPTFRVRAI